MEKGIVVIRGRKVEAQVEIKDGEVVVHFKENENIDNWLHAVRCKTDIKEE